MNTRDFEQMKSYATCLVRELHKLAFDETAFNRIRDALRLAEEMECQIMGIERKRQEGASNVFKLRQIA